VHAALRERIAADNDHDARLYAFACDLLAEDEPAPR
jgi:hypothetical protein